MLFPKWADPIDRARSKYSEGAFSPVNVLIEVSRPSVDNKARAAGSRRSLIHSNLPRRCRPRRPPCQKSGAPRAARNNSSLNFAALGPSYAALYEVAGLLLFHDRVPLVTTARGNPLVCTSLAKRLLSVAHRAHR
jgi:hypothetical protein